MSLSYVLHQRHEGKKQNFRLLLPALIDKVLAMELHYG